MGFTSSWLHHPGTWHRCHGASQAKAKAREGLCGDSISIYGLFGDQNSRLSSIHDFCVSQRADCLSRTLITSKDSCRCSDTQLLYFGSQVSQISMSVLFVNSSDHFMEDYALSIGLTSSQGSNIIVILNAGNFVGRLTAGQLGDKLGTLNILTLFTFMAGLVCVVGWIFAHSFASLAGFSVCWGFFAGG